MLPGFAEDLTSSMRFYLERGRFQRFHAVVTETLSHLRRFDISGSWRTARAESEARD